MATINKCDRCGKIYERRNRLSDKYSIKKRKYFITRELPYYTEAIDLCDVCQEAFEKFMETGIQKEESHVTSEQM